MCFSTEASFGAGIVLSAITVISIKKVNTPSQIFFAAIPLIFALQQITEGFVWLSLTHPYFAPVETFCTYAFLFIAQVIWPIWVPFSIFKLEKIEKRKTLLKLLMGIGALVSCYLAYCLVTFPVHAKILGLHIAYVQDYPEALALYGGGLYVVATIVPPLFSGIKKMWMVGSAILISYLVTEIVYEDYIVSVWCFFASIISVLVYAMMREITKKS